jgi:hypothetical protein
MGIGSQNSIHLQNQLQSLLYIKSLAFEVFLAFNHVNVHFGMCSLFIAKATIHAIYSKTKQLMVLVEGGIFRWQGAHLVFWIIAIHCWTIPWPCPIYIPQCNFMKKLVNLLPNIWVCSMIFVCLGFHKGYYFNYNLKFSHVKFNLFFVNLTF